MVNFSPFDGSSRISFKGSLTLPMDKLRNLLVIAKLSAIG